MADPVQAVVDPFLVAVDAVLGASYSAALYGSVARGDYVPGRSDVNLMLVADDLGTSVLRALGPAFDRWRKASQEPPLIVSRREWAEAADVFPIEITDMRAAYRVVRGTDPLQGLRVDPADLRRALEREFRGKLLRLRQSYIALAADRSKLSAAAAGSVGTMLVLYRALLSLTERNVPREPEALVAAAGAAVGFDPAALGRMVAGRQSKSWTCTPDDFEAYLGAVAQTAEFVDHLQIGDRE